MRACIVIPAYNAEKQILKTLEECGKILIKKYANSVKIIVVSDRGIDLTETVVSNYAKKHHEVRLVSHETRKGKGAALIEGFSLACKQPGVDFVGFVDADDAVSGGDLENLLKRLESSGVDGVIASRYISGSVWVGKQNISRVIASRAYNVLVRLLFGFPYHDTQCGAKLFKKSSMRRVLNRLVLNDMSIDVNILYEMKRLGLRVVEEPIGYRWHEGSTLRLGRQMPQMFIVAIGYRIARSPLNRLFPNRIKEAVYDFFEKL